MFFDELVAAETRISNLARRRKKVRFADAGRFDSSMVSEERQRDRDENFRRRLIEECQRMKGRE